MVNIHNWAEKVGLSTAYKICLLGKKTNSKFVRQTEIWGEFAGKKLINGQF